MTAPYAIYVHFPWCLSRCSYCAFATEALGSGAEPPAARWRQGVLSEWAARQLDFPGRAHSLYFGGGTPSLMPVQELEALIRALPLAPEAEVTLEANPEQVTDRAIAAWRDAGVNRVSIGVQTFDAARARFLGRRATPGVVTRALSSLRESHLLSWSADLIFAAAGARHRGPGPQDLAELDRDLDQLLAFEPPHVSLYGLTLEPGTPLHEAAGRDLLAEVEDDDWGDQYEHIFRRLSARGIERYEVSNFARPGHRARYNGWVWRGGHYAGLGPSAHGFAPAGHRTQNASRWEDWLAEPGGEVTTPRPGEAALDLILSTLRHEAGTCLASLRRRSGHGIDPNVVAALSRAGMVTLEHGHIRLTHAGFPVADGIVRALARGLSPIGDML